MATSTRIAALTGDDADLLSAARLRAARLQPYLASAIFALVPVDTPGLGTFAVDRWWRVYVDMEVAHEWGVAATAAVLVHEAHHVLRDHHDRARRAGVITASRTAWNVAADAAINDDLVADGLPLPDPVLPVHIGCRRGGLEEAYYRAVLESMSENPEPVCGSGSGGEPLEVEIDAEPESTAEGLDPVEADAVRRSVAHDVIRADKRGEDVHPRLVRWARTLVTPQIPWRTLLRSTIGRDLCASVRHGDVDWRRPHRRSGIDPDVLRPGQRQLRPAVALVIDTSASMDAALLAVAVSEVDSLLHRAGVAPIDVVVCDHEALGPQRIHRLTDLQLSGGRGTDMTEGIAVAASIRPTPKVIVVLTDGETDWPRCAPARTSVIAVLIDAPGRDPAPPPTGPGFRVVRVDRT